MTSDEYGYDIPEAQDVHQKGGVLSAISDSWSRCREFGLRASGKPVEAVLSEERFRMVMEQNESIRHLCFPKWNFYTIRSPVPISWSPMPIAMA